jgi:DNA-binding NarL/FixJ family response regulator
MPRQPLVIHERLGIWARQLRPRLASWPIRWTESRSAADLEAALSRSSCPILVLDLGNRPRSGLEDLDRAVQTAPDALVLVLDPAEHAGIPTLARELGASLILSGVVPPPAVATRLDRWLRLARRRAEADGWAGDPEPERDPFDQFRS